MSCICLRSGVNLFWDYFPNCWRNFDLILVLYFCLFCLKSLPILPFFLNSLEIIDLIFDCLEICRCGLVCVQLDLSGFPSSLLHSRNQCSVLFATSKYNFFCFYIHLYSGSDHGFRFGIHGFDCQASPCWSFLYWQICFSFCRDTCLMVLCINSFHWTLGFEYNR